MDGDKKDPGRRAGSIVKLLMILIVACVAITTTTHHCWPQLTGVPEHHVNAWLLIQMDATMLVLGLVAFWHGRKAMGATRAGTFLVSSIIFAGAEETGWILSGRFGLVEPTYYFTHGGLWFFEIPVYTCLAWYVICYCGYAMVKYTFPRLRPAGIAALVAAFGTCWDLWLDPAVCNRHLVSTMPDLWVWLSPTGLRLFGIPILNFAGWFGVIFTVIYVFDKKLRPEGYIDAKRMGLYYSYLGIGWGLLYLALHGVGALQATTSVDLIPVTFGAPVDPATAGTATVAAACTLLYFVVLAVVSFWAAALYRKGVVEKASRLVPAVLIGWWLIGGISTAAQILMVYPGSNLAWLMLVFSAYPSLAAIWPIVYRRHALGQPV